MLLIIDMATGRGRVLTYPVELSKWVGPYGPARLARLIIGLGP